MKSQDLVWRRRFMHDAAVAMIGSHFGYLTALEPQDRKAAIAGAMIVIAEVFDALVEVRDSDASCIVDDV